MKPRAYTKEEAREMLLEHFHEMVRFWTKAKLDEGDREYDIEARLNGLVHSILATFDGVSGEMPAFDLSPCPHPGDKKFHIENGENYWDSGVINGDVQLKTLWYK